VESLICLIMLSVVIIELIGKPSNIEKEKLAESIVCPLTAAT